MRFTPYDRKIAKMLHVEVGDEEVALLPADESENWGVGEWKNYACQMEDEMASVNTERDAAIGDRDRLLAQAVSDMRRAGRMQRGFFACAFLCSVLFVARVLGL